MFIHLIKVLLASINKSLKLICLDYLNMTEMTDSGGIFPLIQAVKEGDHAYIQCLTRTKPIWKKNGISIRSDRIAPGKFLFIKKTRLKDTGNWTCFGKTGQYVPFQATSELLVGGNLLNYCKTI